MKTMTDQEVFDKVARHLRAQGKQAKNGINGSCVYRADDGTMCAVGCLIPDKHYSGHMEGHSPYRLADTYSSLSPLFNGDNRLSLLDQLQIAHDRNTNWKDAAGEPLPYPKDALRNVAIAFGLNSTVLDETA